MTRPPSVVIGAPVLEFGGDDTILRFPIDGFEEDRSLFFRVDRAFSSFLSQRADSAIAALLIPAMIAGKDIEVRGPVSPKLVLNVRKNVVPLLLRTFPGTRPVDIFAEDQSPAADLTPRRAVMTGLSNGIDSLVTVWDHVLDPRTPSCQRVTHFLFNDVGNHGRIGEEKTTVLFEERFKRVKAAADELGLPVIRTASNLDIYYPTTKFWSSHTLRNAAVALALQSGAKSFLYASGYDYGRVKVKPSKDIAAIDAILLPLLSSEELECKSVGSAYTRVQKTRLAGAMDLAREHLSVCVVEDANCSTCWKCARTLLTLELLGRLDDFAGVFSVEEYRRIRKRYVAHVWAVRREDAYCREILDLMDEVGYRMTPSERLLGIVLSMGYSVMRAIPMGVVRTLRKRFGGPMKRSTLSQGITGDILWDAHVMVRFPFTSTTRAEPSTS